jgi:DNA (cytosine-5)-methyltransferase 1
VNVYNEISPYLKRWLTSLVKGGHIAPGSVILRGIEYLTADDVQSATQAHFFAGIGLWSYALRLAGWPDDRPVWTGSCPCQPFSCAGAGLGAEDARHLWPDWFALIKECRPAIIFGEQTSSKSGRNWLAAISADLETLGYTVAAADLCAASVGAPHIRQRLFWVAHTQDVYRWRSSDQEADGGRPEEARGPGVDDDRLGDPNRAGIQGQPKADTEAEAGHEGRGDTQRSVCDGPLGAGSNGEWDHVFVECDDGKARPVPLESGLFPLVDGGSEFVAGYHADNGRRPNRAGQLTAYGNAIVPQVAAVFIRAAMGVL